ncbi:MBG domain-containing protein [Erythrobacter tepidarius]|uniref:MBG domain-containing protein n=1 Tax=Erythrobacter tepidarius TaxID=60454 RepID=UPI000A3ACAD8|nr:MBG domain-containing protein [Erythrobacter tepidarius]
MTQPVRHRSRFMLGCGSAALALALALSPHGARAQGIQATGDVVFGSAEITDLSPTETLVESFTSTVVIDWTPVLDNSGNALDFIRTGATARFESPSLPNFALLNRILPSTNGNIAVIDGTVISRVFDSNSGGLVPGGFVAFYSPTGILIGNNATFDVGSLMLTTLDVSNTGFQNFAEFGGSMTLQGLQGSTARIQINSGAQISALAENSFFAVVAADVKLFGPTVRINGSHAYVAGEVVDLSFSNGLFDISVPVGTAASGSVMELAGSIGGPSSNGVGDNHLIYAVAAAQTDPISMIFRGNLGFDPALSAGIVNGEIILSANYNVSGRMVDGGSVSDGIGAVFNGNSEISNVRADIIVEDADISSSILAIGTHRTQVFVNDRDGQIDGNLLVVGREGAEVTASDGYRLSVTGDVLVSAQDYGLVSSSLQSFDQINGTGGAALIEAVSNGSISIGGNVLVAADGFAGAEDLNLIAGTGQGGSARIGSTGGTININGNATVSARGVGTSLIGILTGATVRGGLAEVFAAQGGQVTLDGSLVVDAGAIGAQGSLINPSTRSDAYGGNAFLNILNSGGSISVGGDASLNAGAIGGSSNNAGAGSLGDGGIAIANVDVNGQITIGGLLSLAAEGIGGTNAGGTGGTGLGGRASSRTITGVISIAGDFNADALGEGGNGQTGGDGIGGIAGANAITGAITIAGSGFANAEGRGGNARFGFGGNGGLGRGGNSSFQANGTLTETALLSIGNQATIISNGTGGNGGSANGPVTPAGRGGDGYGGQFTVPNQADPTFRSGAFLLAGGDNGRLIINGTAAAESSGFGGSGGNGGSLGVSGRGGDAFGGLAQAGLALLGQNGSVGQGAASFSQVFLDAIGVGGTGGFSVGDFPTADGGNATGGNAFVTVRAGTVTADLIGLNAQGRGGDGANGGIGTGGIAAAFGDLGGSLTSDFFSARANGIGGFGGGDLTSLGNGGTGFGGEAVLDFQGISVQINGEAEVRAEGYGGGTGEFTGGNGTGGIAQLGVLGDSFGTGTITGNTIVSSNGFGGGAEGTAGQAGNGQGGASSLRALGGGVVDLATVQVMANGFGGTRIDIPGIFGGNGTGGSADITAEGIDSQITIASNVTNNLSNDLNFGAILSANGVGGLATAGTGVGGTGRGGTAMLAARLGGSVTLPATPLVDPDTVGSIRLQASGFGGNTIVNGGSGGIGYGGNAMIEADGGLLSMGETVLSSFTQGGTAQGAATNVTGGDAIGGNSIVRVINGGSLITQLTGDAGVRGGNGTGSGNGGFASAGNARFEVIDSTVNAIGLIELANGAQGGNGAIGGDALGGTVVFTADNSTIAFQTGANGEVGVRVDGVGRGGLGVTQGGNAEGSDVDISITSSIFLDGALSVSASAVGGDASVTTGLGGTALGGTVSIFTNPSTIGLTGDNLIAADAQGGNAAIGGNATSGSINAELNETEVTISVDGSGVSALRFSSQAIAGLGINDANGISGVGNATAGDLTLRLIDSTITASEIDLLTFANAASGNSEVAGGTAVAGDTLVRLAGASEINVSSLFLESLASSSIGSRQVQIGVDQQGNPIFTTVFDLSGETFGGLNRLWIEENGSSRISAFNIGLSSQNNGGGSNFAGRFSIEVLSGEVDSANLSAQTTNFTSLLSDTPSEVIVRGAALRAQNAVFSTGGNLAFTTSDGGIIGSDGTAGSTNDIFADAGGTISVTGEGSDRGLIGGRSIAFDAGRSILLDGALVAADGDVTLIANDFTAAFVALPEPNAITMAAGSSIDAGTGTVTIHLRDGAGDPQRVNGAITLANIAAGQIDVRNFGTSPGSDITVLADGVLTASGTGRAIDLASLDGEVINLAGDAGLVLTGGGHYGIFAATPTGSQIGSFANYARRYNVLTEAAYDALNPGGNFAAFRISPVLTVTVNDATRVYGNANPQFTASFAGFLPGDGPVDLTGTPDFTTAATLTSGVGTFTINAALGTLLSQQGYGFTFVPGTLTITPRPITVTANNITRVYGNANPALTFTIGGDGLVNGDQLSGALATAAGQTTGVGTYLITQGTLAASDNYIITFNNGQLTITPRPLTLVADSFSRLFGRPDPQFTFQITEGNLVNGDQLTGALVRDPGEFVGTYAIRQGTLTAGDNYTITFVNGQLTIDPPPAPDVLTSTTIIEEPLIIGDDPASPDEVEEERFGIDFPDEPEAPLISEDPLLDDPVTSGGDASLYSGSGTAKPASEDK